VAVNLAEWNCSPRLCTASAGPSKGVNSHAILLTLPPRGENCAPETNLTHLELIYEKRNLFTDSNLVINTMNT